MINYFIFSRCNWSEISRRSNHWSSIFRRSTGQCSNDRTGRLGHKNWYRIDNWRIIERRHRGNYQQPKVKNLKLFNDFFDIFFLRYSKTVKRFSELAKDRPQTALETGIYWTEYIIRHRGAPHISYPAAKMNLIQKNSLDVLAFIFAAIFLAFKVLGFIFKKICCRSKDAKLKVN